MSRYRQGRGAVNTTRKRGKTLGRIFFEERIALFQMAEADELIEKHFHKDAVLISTTNIVWGCEDLKLHFRPYITMLTKFDLLSLDAFIELCFDSSVNSAFAPDARRMPSCSAPT